MKVCCLLLLLLISIASVQPTLAKEIQVKGYTKKDGTVVKGYTRQVKEKGDKTDTNEVKGYTKKDGTVVKGYTRKKTEKSSSK